MSQWGLQHSCCHRRYCLGLLFISCLLLATVKLAQGLWLPIKAHMAQWLIADAWEKSLAQRQPVKPWQWADTWPVARLQWRSSVDLYVLQGTSGNVLAFGPGLMHGSVKPGHIGTSVIAGHRDTHFEFLQSVSVGDELTVINSDRVASYFQVVDLSVVDSRTDQVNLTNDGKQLVLVTCYPFNAIGANGPLRFIVTAKALEAFV